MYNFCTLFDSNYLTRGLALHDSLLKSGIDFHLYIFAFDEIAFDVLEKLKLKNITLLKDSYLHTPKLLDAISDRSRAEYCWTCTPLTIKYCLDFYKLPSCTYLDADIYFFKSPLQLIDEAKEHSVIITEHYYSKDYTKWEQTSGKYNVQFMHFKNDIHGNLVLNWWAEKCIEWCYAYYEDGKMGDQLYLQNWPELFESVHVMKNRGGGVAPWNILNFIFRRKNKEIILKDINNGQEYKLIFYHFHALKFMKNGIQLSGAAYKIDKFVRKHIYFRYIKNLEAIQCKLDSLSLKTPPHGTSGVATFSTSKNSIKRAFSFLIEEIRSLLGNPPTTEDNCNIIRYRGIMRYIWRKF